MRFSFRNKRQRTTEPTALPRLRDAHLEREVDRAMLGFDARMRLL